MCVIIAGKLPEFAILEAAEDANPHGGGIAWKADGRLHFLKGVTARDMVKLPKRARRNCVAHFRIATAGGTGELLTHPFVSDAGATLALRGRTVSPLLFHNGHWADWKETLLSSIVQRDEILPSGEWSDSRAIAFLVARYGETFPALLPSSEKIALMTMGGIKYFGNGWSKIKGEERTWYSNKNFIGKTHTLKLSDLDSPDYALWDSYYEKQLRKDNEERETLAPGGSWVDGRYYVAKEKARAVVSGKYEGMIFGHRRDTVEDACNTCGAIPKENCSQVLAPKVLTAEDAKEN